MATTVERLHQSVISHGIWWSVLASRVSENEGISTEDAAIQVALLLDKKSCTLPVAAALIDLIVAKKRKADAPVTESAEQK